jgi:glycosyltransferase involved in cell wall biosynthesis
VSESSPMSSARPPELSVVVIAYNEEVCIEAVARELRDKLDAAGLAHELVLVDDGSKDATLTHMRRLAASDPRIQVVALSPNRGIGGALRAGFDAARARYVTWVPGDGQISPEAVLKLYGQRGLAPMVTTVYRSRADAWYRHVISQSLNQLIKLRTGQVAKSGGNYLFERSLWAKHAPREDDSMMISTAFRHRLKEAGVPIAEIEIDARARLAGHSKVLNPRTILRTVTALLDLGRRR